MKINGLSEFENELEKLDKSYRETQEFILQQWNDGKSTDEETEDRLIDAHNLHVQKLRRYCGLSPKPEFMK